MALLSIVIVALLLPAQVIGATYYISNDGADSNVGTSIDRPWATLAKATALAMSSALRSGDSILFRRGDVFRGTFQIQTPQPYPAFTVSAYGDSRLPLPVISGSMEVPDDAAWVRVGSSNVYSLDISTLDFPVGTPTVVNQVFVDGDRMTLARWPNRNLNNMSSSIVKASTLVNSVLSPTVNSPNLRQAAGYWTGANIHLRAANWQYQTRQVLSHTATSTTASLLVSSQFNKPQFLSDMGFFFDNVLSELDYPGEWYWVDSTPAGLGGTVYLMTPDGAHPRNHLVELSVYNYGILVKNANGAVFTNVHFDQQSVTGFYCSSQLTSTTITGCQFTNIEMNGIHLYYIASNVSITNNAFDSIQARGILLNRGNAVTIAYNQITNIGLWESMGGDAGGFGIQTILVTDSLVYKNTLNNIGYTGINEVSGTNMVFDSNVINNCLAVLNDGAGFYQNNPSMSNIFLRNTISNCYGTSQLYSVPTVGFQRSVAVGIYFDEGSSSALVMNNTITNMGQSSLKLYGPQIAIIGNTLSTAGQTLIQFGDGGGVTSQIPAGTVVSCNAMTNGANMLYMVPANAVNFGVATRNFYCSSASAMFALGTANLASYSSWASRVSDTSAVLCPQTVSGWPSGWTCDPSSAMSSSWNTQLNRYLSKAPPATPAVLTQIDPTPTPVVISTTAVASPSPVVASCSPLFYNKNVVGYNISSPTVVQNNGACCNLCLGDLRCTLYTYDGSRVCTLKAVPASFSAVTTSSISYGTIPARLSRRR